MYENKCKSFEDHTIRHCCDPNDIDLNNAGVPTLLKNKFPTIEVEKNNNSISSIKICNSENCKNGRPPTNYEYCKLMNVNESNIDENHNVDVSALMPDCYDNKCSNNGIYLQIDKKKNLNELITKHYYLVESTKNDDVGYIKDYFEKDMTINVNDKLGWIPRQ